MLNVLNKKSIFSCPGSFYKTCIYTEIVSYMKTALVGWDEQFEAFPEPLLLCPHEPRILEAGALLPLVSCKDLGED